MEREWTTQRILNLIEHYRQLDVLWNPKHPQNKCRATTAEAWQFLADQNGVDINECRRKIKNLVSQFYRELRREKTMRMNGDGKYDSRWFPYNYLIFLKEKYMHKEPSKTVKAESSDSFQSDEDSYGHRDDDMKEPFTVPLKVVVDEDSTPYEEPASPALSRPASFRPPAEEVLRKRLKSDKTENNDGGETVTTHVHPDYITCVEEDNDLSERVKHSRHVPQLYHIPRRYLKPRYPKVNLNQYAAESDQDHCNIPTPKNRNPTDIFGEYVTAKLKALKSDVSRTKAEYLITNVLYEASLGKFEIPPAQIHNPPGDPSAQITPPSGSGSCIETTDNNIT